MADRRPDDAPRTAAGGRHDRRSLVAALRREAQAERPRFSPTLHEGVLAALATRAASRPRSSRPRRPDGFAGGLAAAAACAALVVVMTVPRFVPPVTGPVATVPEADSPDAVRTDAGIERLPTPEELGASVFTQVATLAALAVGIADLPDLSALDPALLATADDQRP